MKVIGFEEHYGLPAIFEAAMKANDPYALVMESMRKAGRFAADSRSGFPAGIYDLGEARIALPWTMPASMCRSFRTLRRAQSALSRRCRGS